MKEDDSERQFFQLARSGSRQDLERLGDALVHDKETLNRVYAAMALATRASPLDPSLVAALMRATYDPSRIVRMNAVAALGIQASSSTIFSRLVEVASDEAEAVSVRSEAIEALGVAEVDVVPLLRHLLQDKSPQVRYAVIVALGNLHASELSPELSLIAEQDRGRLPGGARVSAIARRTLAALKSRDRDSRSDD